MDHVPGLGIEDGTGRVGGRPHLDHPFAVVEPGRDVQDDRRAAQGRVDLAGDRRRVVDDQHVPGAQVVGQVPEPHVVDAVRGPDQQAHLVPGQPAGLGRSRREAPTRRR